MPYIEIKSWQKDKTIAPIVRATYPDYKKRRVYIQAASSVMLYSLNWSGGSRNEYRACTLDGQPVGTAERFNHVAPWENPAEGKQVPLPQGVVIVRGGYFCGKESTLTLYVHPDDMPRNIA